MSNYVTATLRNAVFSVVPESLRAQIVGLLIATIILSNSCFFFWYSSNRYSASVEMLIEQLFYRAMQIVSLLSETPPSYHKKIISSATTAHQTFLVEKTSHRVDHQQRIYADVSYARLLASRLGRPNQEVLVYIRERDGPLEMLASAFDYTQSSVPDISISVKVAENKWLNIVQTRQHVAVAAPSYAFVAQILITATACFFAIIVVGQVTGPLRSLADNANRLGRGEVGKLLPINGPLEIRAAIEAYNHMEQRIRTFVKDRRSILAAIAHDLRAPMTVLRFRAEKIEEHEIKVSIVRTLDKIEGIIDELLNFSQFELVEGRRMLVLMRNLVGEICMEFIELGHEVEMKLESDASISCDVNGLGRALRNLIQNSIKYGGGQTSVTVSEDGNFVIVTIEDSGPGIPHSLDPNKLFVPLFRAQLEERTRVNGTGLGMGIARSIVRAHGGEITARNLPNGLGFRVNISLPKIEINSARCRTQKQALAVCSGSPSKRT